MLKNKPNNNKSIRLSKKSADKKNNSLLRFKLRNKLFNKFNKKMYKQKKEQFNRKLD